MFSNNLSIHNVPLSIITGHKHCVKCVDIHSYYDIVVSSSKEPICLIHEMRSGRFIRSIRIENDKIDKNIIGEISCIKITDNATILILLNINDKKDKKLLYQVFFIYNIVCIYL